MSDTRLPTEEEQALFDRGFYYHYGKSGRITPVDRSDLVGRTVVVKRPLRDLSAGRYEIRDAAEYPEYGDNRDLTVRVAESDDPRLSGTIFSLRKTDKIED